MTHIAFSSPLPECWPTDYFADSLVSRRLSLPPVHEVDNREGWQVAYNANQLPYRADGQSFKPFKLEEIK